MTAVEIATIKLLANGIRGSVCECNFNFIWSINTNFNRYSHWF